MLAGWTALFVALGYLLVLFGVAHFGDTKGRKLLHGRLRPVIYALTLAVYCTSWTFLGSVGNASRGGYDFLPIYLGPLIGIMLGLPLIARVTHIAKSQKITSVADFIGSRYGKSEHVAAVVAIIAVVGTVPYIALQLKAISASLELIVFRDVNTVYNLRGFGMLGDISLFVTIVLAFFAIAFGTRHIDATEHQNGLMLAVAAESFVKLAAFLAVGLFVVFGIFDGFGDLFAKAAENPVASRLLTTPPDPWIWTTTTLLAGFAIFLLPRQFHVMIVENREPGDLRQVAWQFPAYLVAINVFVIPIALAGLIVLPGAGVDRDFMVLSLPLEAGAGSIALVAFIGALSAATAMVIVESVACGIMISNDLVIPFLLRRTALRPRQLSDEPPSSLPRSPETLEGLVLAIRRIAIVLILLLGFAYYQASAQASLATIGLLSFAAIAQLAPAFFIGLFWNRATARGAVAGLIIGFLVWFTILFLPTLAGPTGFVARLVQDGPFGLAFLAPARLLNPDFSSLVQGVLWSIGLNTLAVVVISLTRMPTPIERLQANLFEAPEAGAGSPAFKLWRSAVTVEELRTTVARYLGEERTLRAFAEFETQRGISFVAKQDADAHTIRFSEHLLASAIGAASSRLVLSLMIRRRNVSTEAALKLLDDASAAIQYSRTLLQHGLDHARQGVTVFDRDLRMMCWNRAFQDIFQLPPDLVRFGTGLDEIINYNAQRGLYGRKSSSDVIARRITALVQESEPQRLRLHPSGAVIEIRSNHLPDGGLVTTYTDITANVTAEEALEHANVTLERRVRQRTEELTLVNKELARAKLEAEDANVSKTRFFAAASHDIIQPLNAARLYATALADQAGGTPYADLAGNVETSLDAVEEILSTLLEISRLDAGKMKAELSIFRIDELLKQLQIEFEPIATAKGITLTFVPSSASVMSDRRLLRRLLQNLISNAIKYTPKGEVLVGCRRKGDKLRLIVADTGIGIPANKQKTVFREFQRLEQGARIGPGLGLGLSIVERIIRVLELSLDLVSRPAKGSTFTVHVPRARATDHPGAMPNYAPPAAAFARLNGLRVVVIDNEVSILEGMRRILENWGCIVTTAAAAQSAILACGQARMRPDVALVDYHLDDATGIEAARRLRSAYGNALPVILITADRSPEMREQAARHAIEVLNKPIKPPALRAFLAQTRLKIATGID